MFNIRFNRSTSNLILALAFAIVSCRMLSYAHADVLTTMTFDDPSIPFQSIDDFSLAGVTFDFKVGGVDSPDAYYKSGGPGTLTYVDDPSLTGDSVGILTLMFAYPTHTLQFGVALNTGSSLSPGFQVEIFDANLVSLGVTPVDVVSAGAMGFAEELFYHAGAAVTRAVIDFQHEPGFFALDNLTYAVIPEPRAALLAAIAALAMFTVRRPPYCELRSLGRP